MANEAQSAETPQQKWGRVFMDNKVSDLHSFEHRRSSAWTDQDQADYLERVREKAEEMARGILQAAQSESKDIREKAYEEGYAAGVAQADAELAELRSSLGDTVQAVLGSIEGQAASLYAVWRDDLSALARLAVEKGLGITLAEDRAKVLAALLEQAVASLESSRRIVVRCNPEDAAAVEDIIAMAKEKYPETSSWAVRGEPSMEPGGILVESESSLANNTIESRRAAIEKVLEGLNIPTE